ncbi:MAG: nucleotide exchange factor GrpE [Actinomycetales bacterium]
MDVEVAAVGPGLGADITDAASHQESDLPSETTDCRRGQTVGGPKVEQVGSADLDSLSQDVVASALRGLEAQIKGFHARAENYEHIVRQMQNRIEQLQGDQVQALLKPVIQRFAGLHAQAVEASEKARERGESAEKDFGFFTVAIEEALGLVDIESVGAAPDVEFDSKKHHASRIVPTADPDLDQRVQRVLRQGFTYVGGPRVLLPAQVSVYRYEPTQPVADDEAHEDNQTSEPGEGDPCG